MCRTAGICVKGGGKMKEMLMWVLIKLTYVHVWIILFAVIAVIAMIYFFIKRPREDAEGTEHTVSSKDLLDEINEERKEQGLHEIPAVNSRSSGTNTYARLDKSFSSVPDFFIKLFSKK